MSNIWDQFKKPEPTLIFIFFILLFWLLSPIPEMSSEIDPCYFTATISILNTCMGRKPSGFLIFMYALLQLFQLLIYAHFIWKAETERELQIEEKFFIYNIHSYSTNAGNTEGYTHIYIYFIYTCYIYIYTYIYSSSPRIWQAPSFPGSVLVTKELWYSKLSSVYPS